MILQKKYDYTYMAFRDFLSETAKEVDGYLDTFFQQWVSDVSQISQQLTPAAREFRESCKGGKRIRGSLVVLGYLLAQKKNIRKVPSDIFSVGAAYEIFQTAILAHDDIIDKSPKRRGKPSLHYQLGGDHHGMSQSLCLGDIGFFLTFRLLVATNFSAKRKNQALSFFSDAVYKTGLGELLDVTLSSQTGVIDSSDVLTVYRLKTAYYTIVAPLVLGAVLGGGDKQTAAISTYGEHVGIAYQIQDDIIDIFGDAQRAKKELGGDIREGKETVLFVLAQKHATAAQKKILAAEYGNASVTALGITQVQEVFRNTGALDQSRALAQEHSARAQAVIPQIETSKFVQQLLHEMTEFFLRDETNEKK